MLQAEVTLPATPSSTPFVRWPSTRIEADGSFGSGITTFVRSRRKTAAVRANSGFTSHLAPSSRFSNSSGSSAALLRFNDASWAPARGAWVML